MAAIDRFQPKSLPTTTTPATYAEAVTPHDTNELTYVSRALWVGSAGNLRVKMLDGQTVTFPNVTVGWHPLRVKQVYASSTTASSIVAVG